MLNLENKISWKKLLSYFFGLFVKIECRFFSSKGCQIYCLERCVLNFIVVA